MSGSAGPGPRPGAPGTPEWERALRRAEVFGETLPETTSDERDEADARGSRDGDTWLREQVPPHHGG